MWLQRTDASNRPYETVEPLAVTLGMTPKPGDRTQKGPGVNVFDNRFEVDEHKVNAPALWSLDSGMCAPASSMCCYMGIALSIEHSSTSGSAGKTEACFSDSLTPLLSVPRASIQTKIWVLGFQ